MLQRERVFSDFMDMLRDEGFAVATGIVNCADYDVPQCRRRLVVLASTLGPIELIAPTTPGARRPTVRDAIADLPPSTQAESPAPTHYTDQADCHP